MSLNYAVNGYPESELNLMCKISNILCLGKNSKFESLKTMAKNMEASPGLLAETKQIIIIRLICSRRPQSQANEVCLKS